MTFYHFTETIICTVMKCDIGTSTWRTHYCFIYGSVNKVYQESHLEPTGLGLNTLGMKNYPETFPFPHSPGVTAYRSDHQHLLKTVIMDIHLRKLRVTRDFRFMP